LRGAAIVLQIINMADARTWFAEVLKQATERAGSLRALGAETGLDHSRLSRYSAGVDGPEPLLEVVDKVIAYLGGDLRDALAALQEPTGKRTLTVVGRVSAGDASVAIQDLQQVGEESLWQRSRLWALSHGAVIHVQVQGDSMAPEYPPGCYLAVRHTSLLPERFPDQSPVILRDMRSESEHEYSFKLLQVEKRKDGKTVAILGNPINRAHRTLVFPPGKAKVAYAVLGKLEVSAPTGTAAERVANGGGLLLHEESST